MRGEKDFIYRLALRQSRRQLDPHCWLRRCQAAAGQDGGQSRDGVLRGASADEEDHDVPHPRGGMLNLRTGTCPRAKGCGRLLPGMLPRGQHGARRAPVPRTGDEHPPCISCASPSPREETPWPPGCILPPPKAVPGRWKDAQHHPDPQRQSTGGSSPRGNPAAPKPRARKRKSDKLFRGKPRLTAFPPPNWGRRELPKLPAPREPGNALRRPRTYGALRFRA